MARGKKHRNGGYEERRKRFSEAMGSERSAGTGKRRRDLRAEAQAPSAAFLAALEAQRAKQTGEDTSTNQTMSTGPSVIEAPKQRAQPQLPGFYYDEAKKRYFKLTKQHLQEKKQKQRTSSTAAYEQKQRVENGRRLRCCGWMGYLAERQCLAVGAVLHRDHRDLVPRFYTSRLTDQVLSPISIAIDTTRDRLTAMNINSATSSISLGYASGYVRSFTLPANTNDSLVEIGSVNISGLSVSCVRHHSQSRNVLVAAVGGHVQEELAPLLMRGGLQELTGKVGLFSEPAFRRPQQVWQMNDPWVVEWCPHEPNLFSIGLGGQLGAALIDYSVSREGHDRTLAPRGRIKSDTLSQTFSQQSPTVVVNGARNGSWWIWDTRAPRRATEMLVNNLKASGSIQCMRLLRDNWRLVTQRSDGELAVLDLRSAKHSLVTLISKGAHNAYHSMLRFDLDESETVVAAATFQSVGVFDLTRGTEMARVHAPNRDSHEEEGSSIKNQPVEQVSLSHDLSNPMLWAINRSCLYQSSPQSLVYCK